MIARCAAMVPAMGTSLTGASYEVIDGSFAAADATEYILQDVDLFGKVTDHGPIMVDRGSRVRGDALEANGREAGRQLPTAGIEAMLVDR